MALETGTLILDRWRRLKLGRGVFESTWQEIANNILGLRDFNETHTPGRHRMRRIYDTTGLLSGHLLAQSLHGLLTNPAGKFHMTSTTPKEAMSDPEIFEWVGDLDAVLDSMFKNPRFGFPSAQSEFYIDLVFFGTGVTYVEDVPGFGTRYYARPLGEIYIDESWTGEVNTIFRHYSMQARQFIERWGKDADPEITKLHKTDQGAKIEMMHLTHPRKEVSSAKLSRDRRPWRSVHVVSQSAKIISESGYWTNPWQVARWSTEAGELYGRSPAWVALSDCLMLNEMGKVLITQSQKLMAPPLLIPDDGVLTQIDTSPDSLNVYRAGVFDSDPIRQFPVSDRTLIGEKILESRQNKVEQAFYAHLLQLFDSQPTATGVLEMESKAARILVSTIARIASEQASPILTRSADIAERGGMIRPRPKQMRGLELRIDYLSPVLRAMKQQEARGIMNVWSAAGSLMQIAPEVRDNLDVDESIRLIAESESVPKSILVALGERNELRAFRAEQQQAAQARAELSEVAGAAGDALPGIAALQGQGANPNGGPTIQ